MNIIQRGVKDIKTNQMKMPGMKKYNKQAENNWMGKYSLKPMKKKNKTGEPEGTAIENTQNKAQRKND